MPGRIECYLHSDNTTPNKAGAMVRVTTQTDYATKNEDFIAFSKKVAKWACGLQQTDPRELMAYEPAGLTEDLAALKKTLKEEIVVTQIDLMRV